MRLEGSLAQGKGRRFVAGLWMGMGCITPGVSGGMLAVSMGLYEPMLTAVGSLLSRPGCNLRFLWPIALGGVCGVALTGKLLQALIAAYPALVSLFFLGLVAGGIPQLWKEAAPRGMTGRTWAALLLGVGVMGALTLIEAHAPQDALGTMGPWQYALCGAIIAVGSVVPGISTSFVLMYLGWYAPLLAVLAALDLRAIALVGAGFVLAAGLTVWGVRHCLRRARAQTYACVLGFLLCSMVLVVPPMRPGWDLVCKGLVLAAGSVVSYWINRRQGA